MDLQTLWFILITVLFAGFFLLEGFDYGVGTLLPFVGKNDQERRTVINAIGPVWDGNEVWLLTAAFPNWYATLFSGFYMALFLILFALIVRGVAFEFRSKDETPRWRRMWDAAIFIGSALPALLWGVAVGNMLRGVLIDAQMHYVGSFFDLLNPYGLLGGLVTLSLFVLHGGLFLEMKTDGPVRERVQLVVRSAWIPVLVCVLAFVAFSFFQTTMFAPLTAVKAIALVVAVIGLLAAIFTILSKRYGLAFIGTSVTTVAVVVLAFATLFPRVLPSTLNAAYDLTIYNASSSQYTLQVMSVIALTLVPIVLAYQAWTYWVFRKRLTTQSKLEY